MFNKEVITVLSLLQENTPMADGSTVILDLI